MAGLDASTSNWRTNAEEWISKYWANEQKMYESAYKMDSDELARIVKYAIENKNNLDPIHIEWLIDLLCTKFENKTKYNQYAKIQINLLENEPYQEQLREKLSEWDPDKEKEFHAKIVYTKDRHEVSMTEEIDKRLKSEGGSPYNAKSLQTEFYILLLNLKEYPHKKLIFYQASSYKRSTNVNWQLFLILEFSKRLKEIASGFIDCVSDIKFELLFSNYFCDYILQKKTGEVYAGTSAINAEIRKIAGADTPVGEIFLFNFFERYVPGCFNLTSDESHIVCNDLAQWIERIQDKLNILVKDLNLIKKINWIKRTDYDA
jgi:hypothetical protein